VGSNPTLSATSAPVTQAAAIAAALAPHLPLPLGSLCVWGDWFGKPLDNDHMAVNASSDGDVLVLTFDRHERLEVATPAGWALDIATARSERQPRLVIRSASRVEWGSLYNGRPETPENWFIWNHWREGGAIRASSTWPMLESFSPSTDQPAVFFL
jgi:hypothetical protein